MSSGGPKSTHRTFAAAVAEAVRLTVLCRSKFNRPDDPPYIVRKRSGRWSDGMYGDGRSRWGFTRGGRESWMVFIPSERPPDRRP